MKLLTVLALLVTAPAFAFHATFMSAANTAITALVSDHTSHHHHKEILMRTAEEDAAAYLAGETKTALLAEAMDYVRSSLEDQGLESLSERELALLILETLRQVR